MRNSYTFLSAIAALSWLSITPAILASSPAEPLRLSEGHLPREISFDSSRDAVIPQLVDGGGWKTSITLMNPGSKPLDAIVAFFDDNGGYLALPVVQLQNRKASVVTATIPPVGSIVIDTADADAQITQGYAVAFSTTDGAKLAGMAVFRQRVAGRPDFEAVVPLSPIDETEFAMPFDNSSGYSTGMAIAYPDVPPAPASKVDLFFYDPQGILILQDSIHLTAGAHSAISLPVRWPQLAGKAGMLIARTDARELSALGLRFTPGGAFTSFHALSLPPALMVPETPIVMPPSLPGTSAACNALDGLKIYAQDNVYLGTISSNEYLRESLANKYGPYGSSYSITSIFNRYGTYGSDYSMLSPFNRFATKPPLIVQGGKGVAFLSSNVVVLPRINPDDMLKCVGRSR